MQEFLDDWPELVEQVEPDEGVELDADHLLVQGLECVWREEGVAGLVDEEEEALDQVEEVGQFGPALALPEPVQPGQPMPGHDVQVRKVVLPLAAVLEQALALPVVRQVQLQRFYHPPETADVGVLGLQLGGAVLYQLPPL